MKDKITYTWQDAARIAERKKRDYDKGMSEKTKRKVKKFKKEYNFKYSDTWELDTSLACWLLPRIAHLRDNHSGVPNDFCVLDENMHVTNMSEASDNWFNTLNTIVNSLADFLLCPVIIDFEKEKVINSNAQKAMELVAKYFLSLWD